VEAQHSRQMIHQELKSYMLNLPMLMMLTPQMLELHNLLLIHFTILQFLDILHLLQVCQEDSKPSKHKSVVTLSIPYIWVQLLIQPVNNQFTQTEDQVDLIHPQNLVKKYSETQH
jgi:hypothetical protein